MPELPDSVVKIRDHFVGKKVLIVGDHPHADRVGHVEALERTHAGYGFKVAFPEGDGCFVFTQKHWRVVQ